MNEQAMRELRRVVEAAPEDRLHMRSFCETAACGTARCAAGWAAIDSWFRENTQINKYLVVCNEGTVYATGCVGDDGVWRGTIAGLATIFDIDREDARYLFGGDLDIGAAEHAVTKDEVLWNIDEMLAGREALPYAATLERVPTYAGGVTNPDYVPDDDDDDPEDES